MTNRQLVVKMLKEYTLLKRRAILLEKYREGGSWTPEGKQIINSDKKKRIASSKGKFELKNRIQKQNEMITKLVDNVRNIEEEYSNLVKAIKLIENALEVVREIDERYYLIIVEHFFNKKRIDDLDVMFCLSRSRCYDLRSKALREMTTIIFGD